MIKENIEMTDCVVVGSNDPDLQDIMMQRESMKNYSGAYHFLKGEVVNFSGKWMSYMSFMNILLKKVTGPDYNLHIFKTPNLAICYLKSFLTRKDLNIEIINFYNDGKNDLQRLLSKNPRSVAITTTFYVESSPIVEIVNFIRQHNTETIIIVGGPYIFNICGNYDKTTQDYLLKEIGADIYINDSQGELTLSRVLFELRKGDKFNLKSIPNLIYRKEIDNTILESHNDGIFERTVREIENNDMDENTIDWSLFPKDFIVPTVQMRSARGCAFACSFCGYPVIAGTLSHMSVEIVEKEMIQLHDAGVENIIFIDDTFNIPIERFKNILRMMKKNKFNFNWFSFFRCANADAESFDLMAESGCIGVYLGIESGDPTILKNMNKKANIEQYKMGIQKLHERNILTYVSLIIGFPGETRETVQNTINFIEETQPSFFKPELFYYAHNVPIHQKANQFGLQSAAYSWKHNTMDWREACDMVDYMYRNITKSLIFPPYMFSVWSILYLYGKGISLESIKEFLRLTRYFLIRNIDENSDKNGDDEISQELLAIGKKIANEMGV